jgi:TonB family protein
MIPVCYTPYQDATVVQQAPALFPSAARRRRTTIVILRVTIGPTGKMLSARIEQSSFDVALDQAALAAARASTYAPKVVNCQPVMGEYLLRIVLDPAVATPLPYPRSCLYGSPSTPTPQPTAYLTREQILKRWRLEPGDHVLGMTRESYADYAKQYQNSACDPRALQQVWVLRIKFTQPHRFKSVLYASGVETIVLDAATGSLLSIGVTGSRTLPR